MGVFGHIRAILTRNGPVTHMLSAGECCSCTTAVTAKPSVPRKCVIGVEARYVPSSTVVFPFAENARAL